MLQGLHPIGSIFPLLNQLIYFVLCILDECPKKEPAVNLIGRNGLCADVPRSSYEDGNLIVLWICKSINNSNLLFTLIKDGYHTYHAKLRV